MTSEPDRSTSAREGLRLWRAGMRHADLRRWADEALGDRRHVYARAREAAPDEALVFLPDGQGAAFRARARAGELVCAVPDCPSPALTARASDRRRDHFAHLHAPADPGHNAAYEQLAARKLLAGWVAAHPGLQVDVAVEISGVTIDVLATSTKTGKRVAICIVLKRLGAATWLDRHLALRQAGVQVTWLLGISHLRPPAGDGPAARADRERGDVITEQPLMRQLRSHRVPAVLLGLETRQLATALEPAAARSLGLQAPASSERVVSLAVSDLDACRLCEHGIATGVHSPAALAELARFTAPDRHIDPPRPKPAERRARPSAVPPRRAVRLIPPEPAAARPFATRPSTDVERQARRLNVQGALAGGPKTIAEVCQRWPEYGLPRGAVAGHVRDAVRALVADGRVKFVGDLDDDAAVLHLVR